MSDEEIRAMAWYYQVELRPGVYTSGRVRGTSSMTREVVRHIGLDGRRCLDVGAQEGLLSVLMARQGASEAACYDRLDLSHRLDLVEQAYDVRLPYFHSLQLRELPLRLRDEGVPAYDVVVFAGVLYHMIDPLAGLATARGLVRDGGLMVIETSVLSSSEFIASANAKGRFYPGSNYFQVSLATLDYFLRMLRLEPIDLLFTAPSEMNVCRATIVARAVDHVVATPDDSWMTGQWVEEDMRSVHLDYGLLRSSDAPVEYSRSLPTLQTYPGTALMDTWATFEASQHHRIKRDEGRLSLTDRT